MKNTITVCLVALLFAACASDSEKKSLDKIAEIYNAKTSYTKSFNSSVGTETMKSFNVKVSESVMIDSLAATVTTANIAMLVYEGLTSEEKDNYTIIDVELVNAKNDTVAYNYPLDVLKEISDKSTYFKTFSESVMNKSYSKIDEIKNAQDIPDPLGETIAKKMAYLEQEYGALQGYKPFGVAEQKNAAGQTAFQYQGILMFKDKDIPYLITADADPNVKGFVGVRFFN